MQIVQVRGDKDLCKEAESLEERKLKRYLRATNERTLQGLKLEEGENQE